MDKSIIRDFAKLRVLTPYDFQRMDELVQDLTNALEESSAIASGKQHKRRGKKRRPLKLGTMAPCSVTPPDAVLFPSEESASSVDEVKLSKGAVGLAHQSDSDGVSSSGRLALLNYVQRLTHLPVGHFVESDSVNENFSPVRPHRRKRKFKRMAVDPSSSISDPTGLGATGLIPIPGRKPQRKKDKSGFTLYHGDVESSWRSHDCELAVSPVFPGKRKHSMRERSVELIETDGVSMSGPASRHQPSLVLAGCSTSGFGIIQDGVKGSQTSIGSPFLTHEAQVDGGEENMCTIIDSSSSSLSSSDSDTGIHTNDEGREGDDEQSDFYHESGPACGIPGVTPWWENDIDEEKETQAMDETFQSILNGSFQHMSYESQQAFRARVYRLSTMPGREIRAGRRRLRDRRPGFTIVSSVNEKISRFLQDPEQNELKLYHMRKKEMDQLTHLASLYSLNMHSEGSKKNHCPVLTKTRNTTQATSVDKCGVGNLWAGLTSANDIKRRRRTPPASPEIEGHAEEPIEPIPETNIGNQMLRNMGWEPSSGLGTQSDTFRTPLLSLMRPKYQGLGFVNNPAMKPS